LPSLSTQRFDDDDPPTRNGGGDRKDVDVEDEAGEMNGEDVFRRCPNDEDDDVGLGGDVNDDEAGIVVRR